MSYLVLARKYRPQTFETVVGQAHVTQTLMHSIAADRVAHAILFAGPRGTGKTTVARILAKAMNCEKGPTSQPCNTCQSCREITTDSSADVFEIDGASNNSVDQIRQLRDNIVFMPNNSRYKIYIIDEVHMLSLSAFNALLKTLEEPPTHVLFLFATTEIQKIPITILSRCQRHDLRRIDHDSIVNHLVSLCRKEKIDIPPESVSLIARQADGSMRDALSLLDQVISGSDGAVMHEFVLDILGSVDRTSIVELVDALISGDVRAMLAKIDEIYINGQDLHQVYNDLLAYLRDMMVVKVANAPGKLINLSETEIQALTRQADTVSEAHLAWVFEQLYRDEITIRLSPHPRMAMEMVLIKFGEMKPVVPIDMLIEKLDLLKDTFDQAPDAALGQRLADTSVQSIGEKGDLSSPPTSPPLQADQVTEVPGSLPSQADEITEAPADSGDTGRRDPAAIWAQVCQQLSEASPALAANLKGSRLFVKDKSRVEIEVRGGEFNLNMVRRKKNIARIEQLLAECFHQPIQIIIKGPSSVGKNRKSKKKKDQLEKQALTHPMVIEALDIFNGRVEKVNIKQEEDP